MDSKKNEPTEQGNAKEGDKREKFSNVHIQLGMNDGMLHEVQVM